MIEGADFGAAVDVEEYAVEIERNKIVLARLSDALVHKGVMSSLHVLKMHDKPRRRSPHLFFSLP